MRIIHFSSVHRFINNHSSANLINLDRLPYMANASWSPYRTCLPGTNIPLIDDIVRWIPGTTSAGRDHVQRIYLLVGRPHCGKSSVSHTIAQMLRGERRLGSAIFLARDVDGRNSSRTIFSTIAYDLAAFHPKIAEGISRVIREDPSVPTAAIERQFKELIVGPTQDLTIIGPVLIIIDGLDECKDTEDRRHLLHVIAEELHHLPANFRILITTRPDPDIGATFGDLNHCRHWEMYFDDSGDIRDARTCIKDTINELAAVRPIVFGKYAINMVQKQLMKRAMNFQFLAATACRYLMVASDGNAALFFEKLLSKPFPKTAKAAMGHLYDAILQAIFVESHTIFEIAWKVVFKVLISGQCPSILAAKSLVPLTTISGCHPIDTLYKLGWILDKVDTSGLHVLMLHPALEAFITDKQWSSDGQFCVDLNIEYAMPIAEMCLHVMNSLFSHNMCQFEDTSLLNSELPEKEEHIQQFVPESLQYASQHWAGHLLDVKYNTSQVLNQLHEFLFKHLLHWIELSSLMGQLDASLASLKRVYEWLKVCSISSGMYTDINEMLQRSLSLTSSQ